MRVILCALAVLMISAPAAADPTKDECIDADTRAQTLRSAGKLHDARAELELCASQACPEIVRADCAERLEEVTRTSPSVIFDVKDGAGADLPATKVTIDGKPLVDRLDGRATPVDPGEHTFVFSVAGHLPNTQHVLVHEGDKERRVTAIVGTPAEREDSSTGDNHQDVATPPPEQPTGRGKSQRIAGVITGVVGLGVIGLGGVFAGVTYSSWGASQSECSVLVAPTCPQHAQAVSDHDTAVGFATASTIAFIAGGVLAAGGIVLYLTAPHGEPAPTSRRVRVVPLIAQGTGGLLLTGEFR